MVADKILIAAEKEDRDGFQKRWEQSDGWRRIACTEGPGDSTGTFLPARPFLVGIDV